jgi:hypothetical protein
VNSTGISVSAYSNSKVFEFDEATINGMENKDVI